MNTHGGQCAHLVLQRALQYGLQCVLQYEHTCWIVSVPLCALQYVLQCVLRIICVAVRVAVRLSV